MAVTVNNSGFNGEIELAEGEAIRFQVQGDIK